MVAVESLLNDILRPSDEVKVVLEAVLAQPSSGMNLHAPGVHDPRHNVQNRCVLAVISHKDDWDLTEEGRWVSILLSCFREEAGCLLPSRDGARLKLAFNQRVVLFSLRLHS